MTYDPTHWMWCLRFNNYHWVDTSTDGLFCLGPLVFLLPKILKSFDSGKYFGFERTWWKLFQKRVVYTKSDIYVFTLSIARTTLILTMHITLICGRLNKIPPWGLLPFILYRVQCRIVLSADFNVVNSRVVRNITVFTKEMEQYNFVDFEVRDFCGIRNIEDMLIIFTLVEFIKHNLTPNVLKEYNTIQYNYRIK